MSFWRTFGFNTVSAVETILDRESFTLEDLLDEEELLQECKNQNKRLLDFLLQPDTLKKLLDYLTADPTEQMDSKQNFKYPYLACEILCLEVWDICEAIYDNISFLDQLWSVLEAPPPLNPMTAGYVSRVAGVLLQRKIAETVSYLNKKENIVDKFIQHLENASVMELLLKLIACEETAEGAGIVKWLSEEKLITALIDKFDPKYSPEIHENASQTLVDIITLSHTLGGSPLVEQLESEEVMSKLFAYILDSDASASRSTLMYGLSVAIEVLKREPNEDHDSASTVEELPAFLRVMVGHLDKFVELVKTTKDMPKVLLTYGEITPVGTHRLKVLEFFCGLHGRKYACIDDLLLKFGILSTCLDLFFSYHWNNFLHIIIQDILMAIFDGQNQALVLSLVSECELATRICKAVEEDLAESALPRGVHRGYMGFVTNISNKLIEVSESIPALADLLDKCDGWPGYVEGVLKNTNEVQNLVLGGAKPSMNDEGESSDNDIQGHSDLVNVFTQYLVNQGFSDFPKDFADEEDDEYDDEDEEEEEEEEEGNGELALDKEFEEPGQHYSTDDYGGSDNSLDSGSDEGDAGENMSDEEQRSESDDAEEEIEGTTPVGSDESSSATTVEDTEHIEQVTEDSSTPMEESS